MHTLLLKRNLCHVWGQTTETRYFFFLPLIFPPILFSVSSNDSSLRIRSSTRLPASSPYRLLLDSSEYSGPALRETHPDHTKSPCDVPETGAPPPRSVKKRLHHPAQRNFLDLDEKMERVLEQRVRIKTERKSVFALRKIDQEPLQVFFIQKDTLSPVPSCDDRVQGPWEMDPRFPSHGIPISKPTLSVNTELPLPDLSCLPLRWVTPGSLTRR
jgi:hypothetical protein